MLSFLKVVHNILNSIIMRYGGIAIAAIILFFLYTDVDGDLTQLRQGAMNLRTMSLTLFILGSVDLLYRLVKHYRNT